MSTFYMDRDRIDVANHIYLLHLDGIFPDENFIGLNNMHHKEYFIIKHISKNFRNYFSELQ